nr:MAG TPA: hypothetical protein [Caudoviricetes sp.]DAX65890.1 MAG TPA: hypothetical protein [Caudoviricetes sp.]
MITPDKFYTVAKFGSPRYILSLLAHSVKLD